MAEAFIFILVFLAVFLAGFGLYAFGYKEGHYDAEEKAVAAIISKLDLRDPTHLIEAIEVATEKKQLLESERDKLIRTIIAESKKLMKHDNND